jgi:hypothetical protein
MASRRRWQLILTGAAVLANLGAGPVVTYHRTKVRPLPGLPVHEYVYGGISTTTSAHSLTALLIEERLPVDGAARPGRAKVKVFQLARRTMQLDHCSLSRVALVLEENGDWTLSLRADQNPWMTGPDREVSTPTQLRGPVSALEPPIPERRLHTEGLKRNQFFVKVRFYGAYPVREEVPGLAPGKPVLFELPTAAFWVQRGYPYNFWARGNLFLASRHFDLIDRVEVEFSYR